VCVVRIGGCLCARALDFLGLPYDPGILFNACNIPEFGVAADPLFELKENLSFYVSSRFYFFIGNGKEKGKSSVSKAVFCWDNGTPCLQVLCM
jgi:hypothetical protein